MPNGGVVMPATVQRGSKGPDVVKCQQELTRHGFACVDDGDFGPGTESKVKAFQSANKMGDTGVVDADTWVALEGPIRSSMPTKAPVSWGAFASLLGPVAGATYSLTGGQIPKAPPGVTFLSSKYIAPTYTNCSMFTAYLLGNGFGGPFSKEQWLEWQVAKGADPKAYRGFGPSVVADWGVGAVQPPGVVPRGGVYLVQSFTTWPKGHSWLVLDYDDATGKILPLEANTEGSGLNGVGFGGLGPIRSTNAKDWRTRTKMTWKDRTAACSQVHLARLAIDHKTVLDWLDG